ncbi:hypothetical protein CSKR_111774 [Clonorchis sinensis]|uniref:Uncharacterized protein n=1 Tax=Clonorchis sinensis TaxID=79923 RepID=A0A3R7GSF6_CLOSI|nr:hypothetical protein CSKR_111774 [Clonorchis sinensis]
MCKFKSKPWSISDHQRGKGTIQTKITNVSSPCTDRHLNWSCLGLGNVIESQLYSFVRTPCQLGTERVLQTNDFFVVEIKDTYLIGRSLGRKKFPRGETTTPNCDQ